MISLRVVAATILLGLVALVSTSCDSVTGSPSGSGSIRDFTPSPAGASSVPTSSPFLIPATPFPQPSNTGPLPTDTAAIVPSIGAGITPTVLPVENTPSPVAGTSDGRIIYLDKDGVTVKSIAPDGTDSRTLFTITKKADETVDSVSVDPTGEYVLYTATGKDYTPGPYYLFHKGGIKTLQPFVRRPIWSPNGKKFVTQLLRSDAFGPIYIYDVVSGEGQELSQVGAADWFADGKRLIYTNEDIYTYDLESKASTRLTRLPSTDNDKWTVQEAHVLPGGKHIIFFGGQYMKNGEPQFGASGNGEQWWWLPIAGGDPQPWTDPEGNGVLYYEHSANVNKIAYVGSTHLSACVSMQTLSFLDGTLPDTMTFSPYIPELNEAKETYVLFNGIGWSPKGDMLLFSITPYKCPDAGSDLVTDSPILYAFDMAGGTSDAPSSASQSITRLHKIAEGSYPTWVK